MPLLPLQPNALRRFGVLVQQLTVLAEQLAVFAELLEQRAFRDAQLCPSLLPQAGIHLRQRQRRANLDVVLTRGQGCPTPEAGNAADQRPTLLTRHLPDREAVNTDVAEADQLGQRAQEHLARLLLLCL